MHPSGGGRGCVGILLHPTEDYVRDRLFAELDKPEFLEAVAADDHARPRDGLTRQAVRWSLRPSRAGPGCGRWRACPRWSGRPPAPGWTSASSVYGLSWPPSRAPRATVEIGDVRAAWPEMTLEEKRELLRMFIEKVMVSRKPAGAPRVFDAESRVAIQWRAL